MAKGGFYFNRLTEISSPTICVSMVRNTSFSVAIVNRRDNKNRSIALHSRASGTDERPQLFHLTVRIVSRALTTI